MPATTPNKVNASHVGSNAADRHGKAVRRYLARHAEVPQDGDDDAWRHVVGNDVFDAGVAIPACREGLGVLTCLKALSAAAAAADQRLVVIVVVNGRRRATLDVHRSNAETLVGAGRLER